MKHNSENANKWYHKKVLLKRILSIDPQNRANLFSFFVFTSLLQNFIEVFGKAPWSSTYSFLVPGPIVGGKCTGKHTLAKSDDEIHDPEPSKQMVNLHAEQMSVYKQGIKNKTGINSWWPDIEGVPNWKGFSISEITSLKVDIRDSEEKAREAEFGIVVTNGTRRIQRKRYEDFLTLRIARGASRETGEPNLSRLTGKSVISVWKMPKRTNRWILWLWKSKENVPVFRFIHI